MNRQEAIEAICDAWMMRDGEFLINDQERRNSAERLDQALRALGVTEEELA